MNKYIFYFLFFLGSNIQSQDIIIVDSITKKPIEFASVRIKNDGFYSDRKGRVRIDGIINDTISFFHLAYHTKNIFLNKIPDSVFLNPKIIELDEIILGAKTNILEIKPAKKSRNYGSWVLMPKSELISYLYPRSDFIGLPINKIVIPFERKKELKEKTNSYAYMRLSIRSVKDSLLGKLLWASESLKISGTQNDKIEIDFENKPILFDSKGIAVVIELIGYFENEKRLNESDVYVRPMLTKKPNKGFHSETFYRYIFKNRQNVERLKSHLGYGFPEFGTVERNLSIGLTLHHTE